MKAMKGRCRGGPLFSLSDWLNTSGRWGQDHRNRVRQLITSRRKAERISNTTRRGTGREGDGGRERPGEVNPFVAAGKERLLQRTEVAKRVETSRRRGEIGSRERNPVERTKFRKREQGRG